MAAGKQRATLAEHDGMRLCGDGVSGIMAHASDITYWYERGWLRPDVQAGCHRLTETGRDQVEHSCGRCRHWRLLDENVGTCHAPDRVDLGYEHAGHTREYRSCEAFAGHKALEAGRG